MDAKEIIAKIKEHFALENTTELHELSMMLVVKYEEQTEMSGRMERAIHDMVKVLGVVG